MVVATYRKGQPVWYLTREGKYEEAKIDNVDLTLSPASYGILLKDSEQYRETESPRLKPRQEGTQTPPQNADGKSCGPIAAEAEEDCDPEVDTDDEFGSFTEADRPSSAQGLQASGREMERGLATAGNHTAFSVKCTGENSAPTTANSKTGEGQPHTALSDSRGHGSGKRGGVGRHTKQEAFTNPKEGCGESSAVTMQEMPGNPSVGPIPLSFFGEEEEEALEDLQPSLELAAPWTSPFLLPPKAPGRQQQHLQHPGKANGVHGPYNLSVPALPNASPDNADGHLGGPSSYSRAQKSTGWDRDGHALVTDQREPQHHHYGNKAEGKDANDQGVPPAPPPLPTTQQQLPYLLSTQDPVLESVLTAPVLESGMPASPAGFSDDFGDFEAAPSANNEEPSTSTPAEISKVVEDLAAHRLDSAIGTGFNSSHQNSGFQILKSGEDKQKGLDRGARVGDLVGSSAACKGSAADVGVDEGLPWYLDPESYHMQNESPAMAFPVPLQGLEASNSMGKSNMPGEDSRGGDHFLSEDPGVMYTEFASSLPYGAAPPPQPQQLPQLPVQQLGQHGLSPTQSLQLLETQVAPAQHRMLQEQHLHHTYVDVWSRLMEECASELAAGHRLIDEIVATTAIDNFAASAEGSAFLRALGQLYLVSQILDVSMRAHIKAADCPHTFERDLQRCSLAWEEGEYALGEVINRVDPRLRQQCQELPKRATLALSEHSRWADVRQHGRPQWQGGLCGVSLLPLNELDQLHVATWVEGRPCLVVLANLWIQRVLASPPKLLE